MTILKQRQRYSPDVHITDEGTVEKTYREKALPLRLFGALFIFWESFIYSKLNGVEGIPRFIGKPDIYSLQISFMGGENLRETLRKPDPSYYEKLGEIISLMHERDVVHIDMRNRRNYTSICAIGGITGLMNKACPI
jgi:tRNA A-37 threonylcarbamoyl transferase component Bud32